MRRLDRWLAHVRKQLPGPMYDHPRQERKPWDEAAASRALFAWAQSVSVLPSPSLNVLIKGIGEFNA